MHVALILESDTPGGTERLVIQIAEDLRRRGHGVVVMGPPDGAGKGWLRHELAAVGFEWVTLRKRSMVDPRAVLDIVRESRRRGITAIHSHEFAPSVFGAVAARVMGVPHVMTMHSNMYFAGAWRRRVAQRWAITNSTAAVAVSADTRDSAENVLKLKPGTIHVIPNGIAYRPGNRERVRSELGVRADEILVLALGNMNPRKAHIILLKALIQLKERRPEVPWRLAIGGSDQGCLAELRQVTEERQLQSRVHLLGHRSDTEDLLAGCDIFAMPSLHEGMPLAIMEAMFASKPVISSRAGGIGEMITDDVDGLLVPVGSVEAMSEGLERLLDDAALRMRLGAAAHTRAERQFGIAPMMNSYLRFYRNGALDAAAPRPA